MSLCSPSTKRGKHRVLLCFRQQGHHGGDHISSWQESEAHSASGKCLFRPYASAVVENEHVYNVDRAQGPPAPGDLKPDEQLESYSVKSAALDGAEKSTSSAEPAETDTAPRPDDSQSLREDKPELAFQQSDFDLEPVSTTVENSSVSPVIVEHLASAETPADEIEAQEAEPRANPSPALRMKATMGSFHLSKSPTTPCTSQRWRIRGYNIVETFF
ncbi:hypothetical protein HF521_016883 [Silurus meridionalis]|uniref:Uncharacterized protein n=1 Tax=Silurus meridionalis TaxID=175797 RepID=A0A8T0BQZ9_SILME|nr:hypothetical protein HF521_016883 [Silurus meridionalis]